MYYGRQELIPKQRKLIKKESLKDEFNYFKKKKELILNN